MQCQEVRYRLRQLFDEGALSKIYPVVHQHITGCSGCRAEYQQLLELETWLHTRRPEVPVEILQSITRKPRRKHVGRLLPAVALVVILLILIVGFVFVRRIAWHSVAPHPPTATFAVEAVKTPEATPRVVIFQKQSQSRKYHFVWIF